MPGFNQADYGQAPTGVVTAKGSLEAVVYMLLEKWSGGEKLPAWEHHEPEEARVCDPASP